MQIIATTITLPTAGTAYSVASRLTSASIKLPESKRVAGIKIQAGNKDVYLVDREGAVTMSA